MTAPPGSVLAAFGVQEPLLSLPGGQGTNWRAGEFVFKPLDMSVAKIELQAGWTAWPRLVGHHVSRWIDTMAVGDLLHTQIDILHVPPAALAGRQDHWARADHLAWGSASADAKDHGGLLTDLRALRRPVVSRDQLIHADLTGNVLFHDEEGAAVIDTSPLWRPREYASAIVAVDAVVWNASGTEVLDYVAGLPDGIQMLIRALIFRMASDRDSADARAGYQQVSDYLHAV